MSSCPPLPCPPSFPSVLDLIESLSPLVLQQSTLGIGAAGRNPELYKTQLCKWWLACSSCQHGINCRFAHGEHELVSSGPQEAGSVAPSPKAPVGAGTADDLHSRRPPCVLQLTGGFRPKGQPTTEAVPVPPFPTCDPQQQPPGSDTPKSPRLLKPELYKTQLCKWWMKDSICQHGSNCSFAHGEADLIQAEVSERAICARACVRACRFVCVCVCVFCFPAVWLETVGLPD